MDKKQKEEIRQMQKLLLQQCITDADDEEYEAVDISQCIDDYCKLQKIVNEADRIRLENKPKEKSEKACDVLKVVVPVATAGLALAGTVIGVKANGAMLQQILAVDASSVITSKAFPKWSFFKVK